MHNIVIYVSTVFNMVVWQKPLKII